MSRLFTLKSELKIDILFSLLEGDKTLSKLKEELPQTRETSILHVLKQLECLELSTRTNGAYKLTPLGVIEAQICKGCNLSGAVLDNHKNFWLTHDVSVIPASLMMNFGALSKAYMIKSTHVDLQKVHNTVIQLLLPAKNLLCVTPIFHTDYIKTFDEILNKGNKIELIVTSEVLEKITQDGNVEAFNKHIKSENLQLYLNNNLKFALTVTENNLTLGLFNLTGEYDYTTDLICEEQTGLQWGHQLFRNTLEQSTKI